MTYFEILYIKLKAKKAQPVVGLKYSKRSRRVSVAGFMLYILYYIACQDNIVSWMTSES